MACRLKFREILPKHNSRESWISITTKYLQIWKTDLKAVAERLSLGTHFSVPTQLTHVRYVSIPGTELKILTGDSCTKRENKFHGAVLNLLRSFAVDLVHFVLPFLSHLF